MGLRAYIAKDNPKAAEVGRRRSENLQHNLTLWLWPSGDFH